MSRTLFSPPLSPACRGAEGGGYPREVEGSLVLHRPRFPDRLATAGKGPYLSNKPQSSASQA